MPAPKTNFIPFSCFGYYDKTFEECEKCKNKKPCKNATDSDEFEEVRKIYKFKKSHIEELINKYKG